MKFLGLNLKFCGDILKLKKLREESNNVEFKKLKYEIMQTHNICEKTVYNQLNSPRPGFHKKRSDIGKKHNCRIRNRYQKKNNRLISEANLEDIFAELNRIVEDSQNDN
jgi:hypothetical protein